MDGLETKLGYTFRRRELLATALTHSSYANEHRCPSNERLEFVGDSVLGMVVADYLYRRFPNLPEGRMTRLRAELVCEQGLFVVAQKLDLGASLRLGRGEASMGGQKRPSILSDCVEAVIAAMYLDGGLDVARRFIDEQILSRIPEVEALDRDYKTELQELVQQSHDCSVSYAVTGESGPAHNKLFAVEVSLEGRVLGSGEGRTKKEAEQSAAKAALAVLER